jgi:hypothetical protein
MARTTNSNILRLGASIDWQGSYSLEHTLFVFKYIPYYLERNFLHNIDQALYLPGSVSIKHVQGSLLVLVSVYDLRWAPRSRVRRCGRYFILLLFLKLFSEALQKHFVRSKVLLSLKTFKDWDASFILNYFKLRLRQDFPVFSILNSLRKLLKRVPGLVGYRVDVTGRYARQQRASKLSVKRGVITLSQFDVNVSYVEDFIILKHGKCGFKIWLNRLPTYSTLSRVVQL